MGEVGTLSPPLLSISVPVPSADVFLRTSSASGAKNSSSGTLPSGSFICENTSVSVLVQVADIPIEISYFSFVVTEMGFQLRSIVNVIDELINEGYDADLPARVFTSLR